MGVYYEKESQKKAAESERGVRCTYPHGLVAVSKEFPSLLYANRYGRKKCYKFGQTLMLQEVTSSGSV